MLAIQHADRVRMANIAQTVNVLQAMILTDKERMLLTPTYHVFEMYSVNQDATLLPTTLACGRYTLGQEAVPQLSASASRDKAGLVHACLSNLDPDHPAAVVVQLQGFTPQQAVARVLTAGSVNAHNTFDQPSTVVPRPLEGISVAGHEVRLVLPPKSVAVVEIRGGN
jgi:alpha-N-arabinofuranosidase